MSVRQNRPVVRSRAALAVGVVGLAVVAIAARMPAPQPPAPQPTLPPMAAPTVTPADTTAPQPDSMIMIDTATVVMATQTPVVEASAAPAAWPVDPVTGQTLVNGIPVVGRVFIQRKVDGLVKIKDVTTVLAPEPMAPEAAVVATGHTTLAPTAVRRQRNPMVQATLWGSDNKPSAVKNRHYHPTTTSGSLGQR